MKVGFMGWLPLRSIEEQRIEWMRHQEQNNGNPPNPAEVQSWYEQQPEATLLRAKGTAENALQAYSEEVLEYALEDQEKQIQESIIVAEIRELKKFWPQFGVNLAGGFVSALLFAALLVLVAFFVINDASPVEIGAELREQTEESNDGDK